MTLCQYIGVSMVAVFSCSLVRLLNFALHRPLNVQQHHSGWICSVLRVALPDRLTGEHTVSVCLNMVITKLLWIPLSSSMCMCVLCIQNVLYVRLLCVLFHTFLPWARAIVVLIFNKLTTTATISKDLL